MKEDPLKKLGVKIKEARELRKYSVEELSSLSRVSSRNIKNIESGNRSELPEEAYLHGFLALLFKSLEFENPEKSLEDYKDDESKFILQSIMNQDPYSFDRLNKPSYKSKTSYFRIYHLYIIVSVLIVIFLTVFITERSKEKPPESLIKTVLPEIDNKIVPLDGILEIKISEQEDLKNEPENKILENKKEDSKKSFIAGKGQEYIKIKILDQAWFQIIGISSDEVLFEGDVFPDKEPNYFFLRDEKGFVVATGNAGALEVDYGEGSKRLGEKGQLTKVYFPKSAKAFYLKKNQKKKIEVIDSADKTNETKTIPDLKIDSQEIKIDKPEEVETPVLKENLLEIIEVS